MPTVHYCELNDVNALVTQQPFSATSKPSDSQVTTIIENVAKRMDASMANVGYVVPVVQGPIALALLREACAWGAAGLAQQVRSTGVTTAVNASGKEVKNIWLQLFDDWVKKLTNPQDPFELPDCPRNAEQLQKQPENVLRSMAQGITDDPLYDPTVAPSITRYQVL